MVEWLVSRCKLAPVQIGFTTVAIIVARRSTREGSIRKVLDGPMVFSHKGVQEPVPVGIEKGNVATVAYVHPGEGIVGGIILN